jgi:hypothetical protein
MSRVREPGGTAAPRRAATGSRFDDTTLTTVGGVALASVDANLGSARGDTRMAQNGGLPQGPGFVGAASPVVETKGD